MRRAPRGREQVGDELRSRHTRRDPPGWVTCFAAQPQTDARVCSTLTLNTAPPLTQIPLPGSLDGFVASCSTYGCSLQRIRLQPAARTVAGTPSPWTRCSTRWRVASWAAATETKRGVATPARVRPIGCGLTQPVSLVPSANPNQVWLPRLGGRGAAVGLGRAIRQGAPYPYPYPYPYP